MKYSNVIYLSNIDSTNNYALANLTELIDKTVIVADIQTNGKARYGKSWISSEMENIYLSIVLRPVEQDIKVYSALGITHYTALTVCNALADYNIFAELKWPNDIMVNSRKIAGVLTENVLKNNALLGIVVGIGLNINITDQMEKKIDQPIISMNCLVD
ncbi:biotin--[acetyl-CoA-carboxylase] ligase, partial [bacterium]